MSKQLQALKEGEWACPEASCLRINTEQDRRCRVCLHDKPQAKGQVGLEIGKQAAEKSKGLFSAEDWVCSRCGNVNWARRNTCNICNAPKVGDVEARTGYGGGFNDRQNVEYNRREDSDDEFDEYGRRKRKSRGDVPREVKGDPPVPEPEPEDLEVEEEEEEDTEEDLSKYDLADDWGDEKAPDDETKNGEAEKEQKKPEGTKDSPASKRSRSTSGDSSTSSSSSDRSRSSSSSSHSASRSRSDSRSRHSRSDSRRSRSHERRRKRSRSHSGSGSRQSSKRRSRSRSPRGRH